MDKQKLMEEILDRYGVVYSQTHNGWQSVRCPNVDGHANADSHPSARLNLTLGLMRCLACELNGDGYNVLMVVEHVDFRKAVAVLGNPDVKVEPDWLTDWVI